MRIRLILPLAALATAIAAAAAPALAADTPPAVTVVAHPTVQVTTDRIAEIPFTLTQCATALDCDASIGLTDRLGLVTQSAPAAYLPGQLGDTRFPGLRLTGAAWRALRRAGRLTTRLIIDLPGGRRQVLGAETLEAPAAGAGRWCVGTRRLAPPCHGSFFGRTVK
jgi:hypothetical protein